jgi:HK97 family phage major capsid protein
MDRLLKIQSLRAAGLEKMDAILAAAGDEALSAEQQAELDALVAADKKLEAEATTLRALEAQRASASLPMPALPGAAAPAASVPAAPAEKGLRMGAALRLMAQAGGNAHVAQQLAEAQGQSGLFANQSVGNAAQGGFLVAEDVSSEIIELLRPASVVMRADPVVIPMPNGNLTVNRQATGAGASYVGEQEPTNATGMTFGQVKLTAKKLRALVPISNDLIRMSGASGTAADRLVRNDLVESLATKADWGLLRGGGGEYTPLGIRNQLIGTPAASTNIIAMNATVNLANVTNDLARLELAIENADVPMLRPAWFMAPRVRKYLADIRDGNGNKAFPEIDASNTLRGKPIYVTTQIPINLGGGTESEIILADMAQVMVGEHMGIAIAVSTEASYLDATGTLRHAFAEDSTVMRAIAQHDLGLRHLRAVSVLTGVTWGA